MAAVPRFEQQLEQIKTVGPNLPDLLQALQVERRSLLAILGALNQDDWERETPCPGWTVHDLVLHLLGDDFVVLSILRDGHTAPLPSEPHESLAGMIDQLNADWIRATAGRLSPRMLRGLLVWAGEETHKFFAGVEFDSPSAMGVSWAGESPSPHGLEVAREYTERWLHQQQLRQAVGHSSLADPVLTRVFLQSLAHCLPVAYAAANEAVGTTVKLDILEFPTLSFGLRLDAPGWRLVRGRDISEADCSIVAPAEPLWRAWTTNGDPAGLRGVAVVTGRVPQLAEPLLHARAIVSSRPAGA